MKTESAPRLSQAWLGDPKLAMLSLVILSVWRWTGYYAVILLAGLQSIPPDDRLVLDTPAQSRRTG